MSQEGPKNQLEIIKSRAIELVNSVKNIPLIGKGHFEILEKFSQRPDEMYVNELTQFAQDMRYTNKDLNAKIYQMRVLAGEYQEESMRLSSSNGYK
ncbi:MAG TPA: hypothetical protein VGO21_05515 [Candidatus Paceibacterota bacterium]|jgi:hypothetical protein|nr:hypothetical protein [Candidatus Paceibacterota bacterium]